MHTTRTDMDPHGQLRTLYRSLLEQEDHYHEFKQLLSLYPAEMNADSEGNEAAAVRARLNDRVREWVTGPFEGLSVMQVQLWRSIIVEERFNVALAPWKEANAY